MLYADSSALMKLIIEEAESGALRQTIENLEGVICSELIFTELMRGASRFNTPSAEVDRLLDRMQVIAVDRAILRAAGTLGPPLLRSLDAIHLATALALGSDIEALITYDTRMADAARSAGLRVESPA